MPAPRRRPSAASAAAGGCPSWWAGAVSISAPSPAACFRGPAATTPCAHAWRGWRGAGGRSACGGALARVDPASAERIQPRDEKRLIRALEVFRLTGRPLTEHFARTRSPLADYAVRGFAIRLPRADTARRVAARVDAQFAAGLLDEVRAALAAGLPEDAHPLGGLVYRQVVEHLRGERDERATRELIVRENLRYARRQLIWFRKEPNLRWIRVPGEHRDALPTVLGGLADPGADPG